MLIPSLPIYPTIDLRSLDKPGKAILAAASDALSKASSISLIASLYVVLWNGPISHLINGVNNNP